jgi:hypothetical protein
MKILLLSSLFFIKSCVLNGQINIDKMSIYNYFPDKGFTTAGLYAELKVLKTGKINLYTLEAADVNIIEKILSNSKVKKHHQRKTGVGPFFGVLHTNSKAIDIIVFKYLIIDMTNYVNYWIQDEKDQTFLTEMLVKIKNNSIGK